MIMARRMSTRYSSPAGQPIGVNVNPYYKQPEGKDSGQAGDNPDPVHITSSWSDHVVNQYNSPDSRKPYRPAGAPGRGNPGDGDAGRAASGDADLGRYR